jgi:hypothetical protein
MLKPVAGAVAINDTITLMSTFHCRTLYPYRGISWKELAIAGCCNIRTNR